MRNYFQQGRISFHAQRAELRNAVGTRARALVPLSLFIVGEVLWSRQSGLRAENEAAMESTDENNYERSIVTPNEGELSWM